MDSFYKTALVAGLVCLTVWVAGGSDTAAAGAAENGDVQPLDIRHHDIEIRLWPETHELDGFDRITFEAHADIDYSFFIGNSFSISSADIDGGSVNLIRIELGTDESKGKIKPGDSETKSGHKPKGESDGDPMENMNVYKMPPVAEGQHVLSLAYEGVVYDTLKVPEGSRSGIPEETTGLIGTEGIYLCGETGWYPDAEDVFATFSIRVTTPATFEAVTEGKRLSVIKSRQKTVTDWEVLYPTQDVTLIAGEYLVREKEIEGVTLMAYFFPSEEDLIESYLDASGRYIRLYNGLIGPYPFSKFAVVENFFPTGFGMPSYTLLGRRVIRLPFIVSTSLGHEVAHNWWGNSVYPRYDAGNWCEGLTSYYADYRYKEQVSDSAAARYRRDINIDYATFVDETNDMPLIDFRSREDDVSRIVGYGKCMMVFHMLKNAIGEDKFYRAMRNFFKQYKFQQADWEDIETVFEEVSDGPLDAYFDQWVRKAGAPRLSLENVRLTEPEGDDGVYVLEVTIGNEGGFELTGVPVTVVGPAMTKRISVAMTGDSSTFDWRLGLRPERIEIDPDHELFRRLDPAEIPVTIRQVLADTAAVIALPSLASPEKLAAYRELADRLAASGKARVAPDSTLSEGNLAANAVIALGALGENTVYRHLEPPEAVLVTSDRFVINGVEYADSGHAAFAVYTNPLDSNQTVCVIVGNSPEAIRAAGHKVVYYGKYGFVTFLDGERLVSGDFPVTRSPLVYHFND